MDKLLKGKSCLKCNSQLDKYLSGYLWKVKSIFTESSIQKFLQILIERIEKNSYRDIRLDKFLDRKMQPNLR